MKIYMNKKYNIIDLFCGAGGLSHGFNMAGFHTLLGIDHIDTFVETFSNNHPKSIGLACDITKLSNKKIKELIKNKKVDLIVGGPPCQGFSMAGRRDPKDPRNSLFMEYLRIVKFLKPKYFVLENVRGLLSMKSSNGENVISIIKNEFNKINYDIEYKVLNSANYGVPQKRFRVIVLGTKKGSPKPIYPDISHSKIPDNNLFGDSKPWVGVKEALFDKKDIPKKYFHSEKMIKGFIRRKKENLKKGRGFGAQYLRLDEPSFTISARYYKDGSDALVKYNEKEIRMLTEREAARIQTFPDNYKFSGSRYQVYQQIGNAVPCLMAKAIALKILKSLNNYNSKTSL